MDSSERNREQRPPAVVSMTPKRQGGMMASAPQPKKGRMMASAKPKKGYTMDLDQQQWHDDTQNQYKVWVRETAAQVRAQPPTRPSLFSPRNPKPNGWDTSALKFKWDKAQWRLIYVWEVPHVGGN